MTDEELIERLLMPGGVDDETCIAAADRIEKLVERNKELALQLLATQGQAAEAEAKLAKAVEALDKMNVGEGWAAQIARATLALIEKMKDDLDELRKPNAR